jgi:hypothetical protein
MAIRRSYADGEPVADERDEGAPRRRWGRRREVVRDDAPAGPTAGERAAGAAAGTVLLLTRIVRLIVGVVVLIIALGILFVVLDANASNTIVSHVRDWAKTLAGPFDGMFKLDSAKGTLALNWGIAILVYMVIGAVITRLLLVPARPLRRRSAV